MQGFKTKISAIKIGRALSLAYLVSLTEIAGDWCNSNTLVFEPKVSRAALLSPANMSRWRNRQYAMVLKTVGVKSVRVQVPSVTPRTAFYCFFILYFPFFVKKTLCLHKRLCFLMAVRFYRPFQNGRVV